MTVAVVKTTQALEDSEPLNVRNVNVRNLYYVLFGAPFNRSIGCFMTLT